MSYITIRGVRCSYRQEGAGPDVVLIHGVAGNMAVWYLCGLVQTLTQHFRVTAYDLRGHGYSDTTPSGYTSREMAEDLRSLLRELDLRPAYLLGHSFGAAIALQTASLDPNAVAGVILSDAYLPGLAEVHVPPHQWPGWQTYRRIAAEVGLNISDDWDDLDGLFQQVANLTEDQRQTFARVARAGTLQRLVRAASTTVGRDVADPAGLTAERILAIRQPLICVYGAHSPFRRIGSYLAEHLPDVRLALVAEAEHFAFDENPDEYVRLVNQHLCDLAGFDVATPYGINSNRRLETRMTHDEPIIQTGSE